MEAQYYATLQRRTQTIIDLHPTPKLDPGLIDFSINLPWKCPVQGILTPDTWKSRLIPFWWIEDFYFPSREIDLHLRFPTINLCFHNQNIYKLLQLLRIRHIKVARLFNLNLTDKTGRSRAKDDFPARWYTKSGFWRRECGVGLNSEKMRTCWIPLLVIVQPEEAYQSWKFTYGKGFLRSLLL